MQEYEIPDANGGTYTVQLDDEDAKARGLKAKAAEKPANKARKPASNKKA